MPMPKLSPTCRGAGATWTSQKALMFYRLGRHWAFLPSSTDRLFHSASDGKYKPSVKHFDAHLSSSSTSASLCGHEMHWLSPNRTHITVARTAGHPEVAVGFAYSKDVAS